MNKGEYDDGCAADDEVAAGDDDEIADADQHVYL